MAVATAVSSMAPWLISAWLTVYVPVHVALVPGARGADGQDGAASSGPAGAAWVSVTARSCTETFPLLVTRKLYATACPAALTAVGEAVLVSVMAGDEVAVTEAVAAFEVKVSPLGESAVALAVSSIEPWSISA